MPLGRLHPDASAADGMTALAASSANNAIVSELDHATLLAAIRTFLSLAPAFCSDVTA